MLSKGIRKNQEKKEQIDNCIVRCRGLRAKNQIPLKTHQPEVDKEAGVLAGLGEIGEECGHADDESQSVLTHVAKGLKKKSKRGASELPRNKARGFGDLTTGGVTGEQLYKETQCLDFDYAQ